MRKIKKRIRFVILTSALHAVIFVIGIIVLFQLQNGDDTRIEETAETTIQHQPETVTVQASLEQITLEIQGRVQAENRIELFPEVQGKVVAGSKPFREGVYFDKGEVLFQIDDKETRLQLYSARSSFQTLAASMLPDIRLDYPEQMNLFEKWYESLHPEESLPEIPDFNHPALVRFLTARGVYDRYYQIKSTEDRLDKFTIRAHFTGVLSAASAEPGQSVGPQVHVGTFVDPGRFLFSVSIRQSHLEYIDIGDTVDLTDQHRTGSWMAKVVRINPSVDPRSQTVEIYLEVGGNNIREGMYLEGLMITSEPVEFAEIPKTALLRNSYVYIVSDGVISQIPVTVMDVGHQMVRVTGLDTGIRIIRDANRAMSGQITGEVHQ